MKNNRIFRNFLMDTVNLNQTRIDALVRTTNSIKDFIRASDLTPSVKGFIEQGSWAHQTIIKPVHKNEFDADLLVKLKHVDEWDAEDYVNDIARIFSKSGRYRYKCKTWDYCVTITYASEHKVDIAPCIDGRLYPGRLEVCNREENRFERSSPLSYTDWLTERNLISGNNSFRKATRLVKYLRDVKRTFSCPSVLLTTLLGMQISEFDRNSPEFQDTPTTLRTLMQRLDDWLQSRPNKPSVPNPVLHSEDLSAMFTQEKYANFRSFVKKYRSWIDEAYDAKKKRESVEAWRRVFGSEFGKGELLLETAIAASDESPLRNLLSASASHIDCMVEFVKRKGALHIPDTFNRQAHMQPPPWPRANFISSDVRVIATWKTSRNANANGVNIESGEILKAHGGLWLEATLLNGNPIPQGHRVEWRITNTGSIAWHKRSQRGDFYVPMKRGMRWEDLEYRGVHIAEAFVIDMSRDTFVAQSAPFHVVIE